MLLVVNCGGGSSSPSAQNQNQNNEDTSNDDSGEVGSLPLTSCIAGPRPNWNGTDPVVLQRIFPDLPGFGGALGLLLEPGGNNWYVLEKTGRIFRFENTSTVSSRDLILDIRNSHVNSRSEGGLLGMAFDPDFATNGHVYLSYTTSDDNLVNDGAASNFRSVISRVSFNVERTALDISTEKQILTLPQPAYNHNGGHLAFGPDGYLYIGFGDGGSDLMQSQFTNSLYGAMLRIDVTDVTETENTIQYTIPASNPFSGSNLCTSGSGTSDCAEIYAWGFRNPWRWSFDRGSGELWLADVGSQSYEEVDRVTLNSNYGWPCYEGDHQIGCYSNPPTVVAPVYEYPHPRNANGNRINTSITGGYVYRGSEVPALTGQYVFGDFNDGSIWALRNFDTTKDIQDIPSSLGGYSLATFAEDRQGELYVLHYQSGAIYKFAADAEQAPISFPSLLSETGCANKSDPRVAAEGMIPFNINSRLWSDNAVKHRWMALPQESQISIMEDGDWVFPVGSILRKDFYLNDRIVETRLLANHSDGGWAGYSYEWNADQTEATLLPSGAQREVEGQTWSYPSGDQCLQCHTQSANRTLGPETAQMNRNFDFPGVGVRNQLDYLDYLGALDALPAEPATMPDPSDTNNPDIAGRARAYLHANCAGCHRAPGVGRTPIDLRYDTPLADMQICNVAPHPE
ncbi:MAG: PQQ-dependent sugar dehydrogenase, partial [Gammaproteobacteria bacterium]|nr:PQQ-dependent sugar dehydrogenase [Gammaproteobacteria bacterium]